VIKMTGSCGRLSSRRWHSSTPFIPLMLMSLTTTSMSSRWTMSIASLADAAVATL